MYEDFYGLRERPFDLVPNPRFLFLAGRQREAISNLKYGLTTARGLTLLLGEAGTGKTTLVQAALADVQGATVRCVLLSNPTLTRTEFYEFLAQAFELSAGAGASKARFLFELRRLLQDRMASGVLSALVIDEAQSLPHELLEEIRLLSNIETTTTKLLNVVLAGQPELAERLNESSLRQLKQRISLRCELRAMDLHETASYIAGRIRIAGGRPERVFTAEAVRTIFDVSGGLPRTVNVICDNALIGGFAEQIAPIPSSVVADVCRDFDIAAPGSAKEGSKAPVEEKSQETPLLVVGPRPVAAPVDPDEGPGGQVHKSADSIFSVFNRKRRISFF